MYTVAKPLKILFSLMGLMLAAQQADAAIALDRTRVVFNAGRASMTVPVTNQNKALPYLAQTWVEDASGNKVDTPLTALPPVQRVEPGAKGQIKIQTTGALAALPQDRETLFYFNVREIPPKSTKPNTLQLALQTRVKMFYRPAGLEIQRGDDNEAQKSLILRRQGDGYQLTNPTPYFVTIVAAAANEKAESAASFKPVMVAPKSSVALGARADGLGAHPVLTFVNDFGGRPQLTFSCQGDICSVSSVKAG